MTPETVAARQATRARRQNAALALVIYQVNQQVDGAGRPWAIIKPGPRLTLDRRYDYPASWSLDQIREAVRREMFVFRVG
jgi:hypothetical protein